jgi:hypothetical protein
MREQIAKYDPGIGIYGYLLACAYEYQKVFDYATLKKDLVLVMRYE